MTTLADVQPGEQFPLICQVASISAAGVELHLYGSGSTLAATITVAPNGTWSGLLVTPPSQIPITIVPGSTPVSAGDVLSNDRTGETSVCRWSQVGSDGSVLWSASPSHTVVYPTAGWTIIGHVDLDTS